jgi:hypothetical protein
VFNDPDIGDVVRVFRSDLEVIAVRSRSGKKTIEARVDGQVNRIRVIDSRSWREYRNEGAVVIRNGSIADGFESLS